MTHKALMCFGCLTKLDKAKSCLALLLAVTYHNNTGVPDGVTYRNAWRVEQLESPKG